MSENLYHPPNQVEVKITQLAHAEGLPIPTYQTSGSSGMDAVAAIAEDAPIVLKPMARALVPTGLQVSIPENHEIQIRPRSGLAIKHGISLVNTPGTIDADYRGEIKIIMINFGQENVVIKRGMRIAQMVLCQIEKIRWRQVENLDQTERSGGGFGSTGVH